ncbi:MAG: thiolase domain-containing protein [Candidatus Eremiobacteraeota bacterium]|nr:thiolase domain-containing protein [Candidatus Eremiobacteraeota bacterium]
MRDVAILGVGMTPFGRLDENDLLDLLSSASLRAMEDAGIGDTLIDAVYVANMGGGILNHQTGIASALVDNLALLPAAADLVENGPASGASAVKNGVLAVASGYYDFVLVVGGEKMRDVTGWRATDFVATLTHPYAEYIYGVSLPGMAGMFAKLYMDKYDIKPEHLAMVAMKNQENGILNPYAHIQMKISMEGMIETPDSIVNNSYVAKPLRLFDCCPVSDGAAAVILCPADRVKDFGKPLIKVAGFGQATDTHTLAERDDPTDLKAVTMACNQAYKRAGITAKDIQVAELHDAFTILEIAESEHAGLFAKGEAKKALEAGETKIKGSLPINPSGGLKARGHPVGATGVAQIVDLTWQLRGEAGPRQVENHDVGLTVNFGGFGNNVVAFVLRRES